MILGRERGHVRSLTFPLQGKRGQMKMQQMAFMLIAVTILFVFVGLFFLKIILSDNRQSANVLEEKNALLLVSKLADSPEFSCGSSFGGPKSNCVDFGKVVALKDSSEKYSKFWDVEGIIIRKVFPEEEKVCTRENYPDCGEIVIIEREGEGIGVSNFVSLCRKEKIDGIINDICEIARIIVYYKEA